MVMISTTILNWNRSDLLERTIQSYLNTISVPYELTIVDNASTDNSRIIIGDFCSRFENVSAIFLPNNLGGEAINLGFEKSSGDLFHISENDIEYLPGWDRKVVDYFEIFPQLGQLSLFGPVPNDQEIWVLKQSVLRHSRGRILYEAQGNVSTTSVFKRAIWDKGVRFKSIANGGEFCFPDDISFSKDVAQAGYTVAWSDHYLVNNLGHFAIEFERRKSYYQHNYQAKASVGEAAWNDRIRRWDRTLKPDRRSFLFPEEKISPEKSNPTEECSEPQLWSMFDGWTAEIEVIEFLYALTKLIKPRFVVETGTWRGMAATAIGLALRDNGGGKLVTLETDIESCRLATDRIVQNKLEDFVEVLNLSSLSYTPHEKVNFLLLDSELDIRSDEFNAFLPMLCDNATVVFHDTSTNHRIVRSGVNLLMAAGILQGFFVNCPRGLGVFQLRRSSDESVAKTVGAWSNRWRARISSVLRRFRARILRHQLSMTKTPVC